jgi:hypothetical protein
MLHKLAAAGLASSLLAAAVAHAAQAGNEFTYQGSLKESGAPANGTYDFLFQLYDAEAAGVQVGADVTVDDLNVNDGLFSAPLDFGNVYDGSALWLAISVRPGASGGAYTPLSPRQPLTIAPMAAHAFNGQWQRVGTAITNENTGFVGVNRSSPVTGAEYFGIQAPVQSGYGGMYIRTDGSDALPFYGYSTGTKTAWTYLEGSTGNWQLYNNGTRMTVEGDTGNVGIGTTTPIAKLHVSGTVRVTNGPFIVDGPFSGGPTDHSESIYAITQGDTLRVQNDGTGRASWFYSNGNIAGEFTGQDNNGTESAVMVHSSSQTLLLDGNEIDSSSDLFINNNNANDVVLAAGGGNVGIDASNPTSRLHILNISGTSLANFSQLGTGGGVLINMTSATNTNPALTILQNNSSAPAIDVAGTARVEVIEITGADLAEKFPVSEQAEPGMVMEIDARNAGQLCLSRTAYNRRVAGVVSGAGDIPVGAVLGRLPGHEDAPAIALSGRVWVHCDAREHAVAVGDLLTTSALPGHAMKVTDHQRAQGAIIGKAMSALPQGETGLVLCLVNLQ